MSDLKLDAAGTPHVTYESTNGGVYKFENDTWTPVNDAQIDGLTEGINSIHFDENDERWLTVEGEVYSTNMTNNLPIVLQESPLIAELPRLVREAADGTVYCYSGSFFGGKLVKFNSPTDWEEIELSDDFTTITDLEITSAGDLIVSTVQGLFQYQNETWTEISGFPSNVPSNIALDSENGIWVTTSLSGLYYYDGSTWTTYTVATSGLSSDFVNSVSVDRNDELWVVTLGQNLEHFDGTSWEVFNQTNSSLPETLGNSDIYFDANNELWFPIFNSGIFHFDGADWEEFIPEFVNTFIQYKISADTEGTLYAATSWGIYQFDGATWQPFLNEENSLLLEQESSDIMIGQNDFFWVSTEEGLFIYNSEIISAINNLQVFAQDFLTLYPNPTTDFISIKSENFDNEIFEMSIYDNTGRLLRSKKMKVGELIDVTDLTTGVPPAGDQSPPNRQRHSFYSHPSPSFSQMPLALLQKLRSLP